MAHKLYFPLSMTLDQALDEYAIILEQSGFTVDRERDVWLVLRATKDNKPPTAFYTGLTSRAKAPRQWLRVTGFHEDQILDILNGVKANEVA